jgi:hypothetical protein
MIEGKFITYPYKGGPIIGYAISNSNPLHVTAPTCKSKDRINRVLELAEVVFDWDDWWVYIGDGKTLGGNKLKTIDEVSNNSSSN